MGRGKDLKPRKQRKKRGPQFCLKHKVMEVRRPSGDLRCRECYNEKASQYRQEDPIRYSAVQRRAYLKDPRVFMLYRARIRAKQKSVDFLITKDDIHIPEFCPVLGIPLVVGTGEKTDNSPSLDRVIPSMGYVKGNVQVISDKANTLKSHGSLEELEKVVAYLKREAACSTNW